MNQINDGLEAIFHNYTADTFNKGIQWYRGPIPETVGGMRLDGKEFAGGDIVFRQRLKALLSGDEKRINAWGSFYYLADLCAVFEDSVKLQANSGLLTGIGGIIQTNDGLHVAVDAKAVESAVGQDRMKYFPISLQETVHYRTRDGEDHHEDASNSVLMPYNGVSMRFTPDQFTAINASAVKRKDMISDEEMKQSEIISDGKVVHPAWKIYPANVVVPLVRETFKLNKREFRYDTNMGLYLPDEPKNNGEARALAVSGLRLWSSLVGMIGLGGEDRLLGVEPKYAKALRKE